MLTGASIFLKRLNGTYRWEKTDICPLCGQKALRDHARYRRGFLVFHLQRCDSCELVLQNPRLSPDSLNAYYTQEYRSRLKKENALGHVDNMFARGVRRGGYIAKYLEKNGIAYQGKNVFEYGCGYGGILEHFRRNGCRVQGCDVDKRAVKCGQKQGLALWVADERPLETHVKEADVVILSHVLEHLAEPKAFLETIKRVLKPKGFLYVEVPGIKSPKHDIARNVQLGHLLYFQLATLRRLCERCGFNFIDGDEIIQSCFQE